MIQFQINYDRVMMREDFIGIATGLQNELAVLDPFISSKAYVHITGCKKPSNVCSYAHRSVSHTTASLENISQPLWNKSGIVEVHWTKMGDDDFIISMAVSGSTPRALEFYGDHLTLGERVAVERFRDNTGMSYSPVSEKGGSIEERLLIGDFYS